MPDLAWYCWLAIAWPVVGLAFWVIMIWYEPARSDLDSEQDDDWISYLLGAAICVIASPFMIGLWLFYVYKDWRAGPYVKQPAE